MQSSHLEGAVNTDGAQTLLLGKVKHFAGDATDVDGGEFIENEFKRPSVEVSHVSVTT